MCVCLCVYVCVTYVVSTVYLFHFISDPDFLRLSVPVSVPDIRRLRSLPCYTLTTARPLSYFPSVVPSLPSRSIRLDLATPGREH